MEDKIEINEYVRTNKGRIGKVAEIRLGFNKDLQVYQDIYILDNGLWTILDYIVKHSKQLIGVIKCGDFVNGMEILHIEDNKLYVEWNNEFEEFTGFLENKDIKTILTKESYMANCYKVGGEDDGKGTNNK